MSWLVGIAQHTKLLHDLREEEKREEAINKIINLLETSNKKIEEQSNMIRKLLVMISKMYHEGEINKDTFNKLDDFLKPYYDNSNLTKDY